MRVKVSAGLATIAALLALWITAGGDPEGPDPVTPGTANVWVDLNGGSCVQDDDPAAYDDATACGSAQAAYNAAGCGDVVRYKAGSYGAEQAISAATTGKSCTAGQEIVFRPEDDAVNAYGTQSSVILTVGIGLDAVNCTCRFEDFDTYVDTGVAGAATDTRGVIGSNRGGTTKGSVKAEFRRVDAHLGYIGQVQDVTITDGSFGDFDSCVDDPPEPPSTSTDYDGLKIWGTTSFSDRITVDGTVFHNIRKSVASPTCDFHTDGIQVGSGEDITLRNLRMYDMPTSGILARPQSGIPLTDFTVENNMLGPVTDGTNGILACNEGDDCGGITVRYNTLGAGDNIVVRDGLADVIGNSTAAGYDLENTGTVANNVYSTVTPGGTDAFDCVPTWEAEQDPDLGQLHIGPEDACMRSRGHATLFPATDFDGNSRPVDDPDIGADEIGDGSGLRFATGGQATYSADAVDLSATAYTLMVMWRPRGADGVSRTLLSGETSARVSHWAMYRLGTGFWTTNSLGLYRLLGEFQDLVWPTTMDTVASDGLIVSWISKVNGGGVPAPVLQFKAVNGAWVHDTGSPTTTNFQLANGDALGADGVIAIGSFEDGTDTFDGDDVYAAAIWEDQLTNGAIEDIMEAETTADLLATTPAWAVDFSTNLETDLTGNGGDMLASEGVSVAPGMNPDLWTAGG